MSNHGLPNVRLFLRLMVDPGWAPIAVAAAFLLMLGTAFPEEHDYVFHLAGGAAIAYFVWRTIAIVPALAGRIAPPKRPVVTFLATLVVAVLWEVAELAAGTMGVLLQHGPGETVRDIAYGALGAIVFVVLARAVSRLAPAGQGPTEQHPTDRS